MPLFSRRNQPADANTAAAVGDTREHEKHAKRNDPGFRYGENTLSSRPSFGQWLKLTWPDILTMIVMGAIGLGVYEAPPAPSRSFPVDFPNGNVVSSGSTDKQLLTILTDFCNHCGFASGPHLLTGIVRDSERAY